MSHRRAATAAERSATAANAAGAGTPPTVPAPDRLFEPATTAVVFNPVSGRIPSRRKAKAMAERLRKLGFQIVATSGPDQAGRQAREAVERGCTAVLAFGGDGTLYETIAELPPHVGVGFFPAGTVNLFARGMKIPMQSEPWHKLLMTRSVRPVYFGLCNGRPFGCVASIGFDALVVEQVSRSLKRWIQEGAYAVAALRAFAGYSVPDLSVTLDGKRFLPKDAPGKLIGVIAGRVPYYGGPHRVLPTADPLQPQLGLALLFAKDKWSLARFGRGILLGTLPRMKGVYYETAREVTVSSAPASPVELDGDAFAHTPVKISVEAQARWVLAP